MCLWPEKANISYIIKIRAKNRKKKCARIGLWLDPIALKIFSDQTNVRLNLPFIRSSQRNMTSDQTITIRKWPLIDTSPDHSDLWSYLSALETLEPRFYNFGLGTNRLLWTGVWSNVTSHWHLNLELEKPAFKKCSGLKMLQIALIIIFLNVLFQPRECWEERKFSCPVALKERCYRWAFGQKFFLVHLPALFCMRNIIRDFRFFLNCYSVFFSVHRKSRPELPWPKYYIST